MKCFSQFLAYSKREGIKKSLPLLLFLISGLSITIIGSYLFVKNEIAHSKSNFEDQSSNLLWTYEHEISRVAYYLKTISSHFRDEVEIDDRTLTDFTYPYLLHEPQVLSIRWEAINGNWVYNDIKPSMLIKPPQNNHHSVLFIEPVLNKEGNRLRGYIELELSLSLLASIIKDKLQSEFEYHTVIYPRSGDNPIYQDPDYLDVQKSNSIFAPNFYKRHNFIVQNTRWEQVIYPSLPPLKSTNVYFYLMGLLLAGIVMTIATFNFMVKGAIKKHEIEQVVIQKTADLQKSNEQLEQQKLTVLQMLKQAETERKKAEHAHEAKSKFLSIMSHEIRTPLNAIIGFTNILKKEVTDMQLTPHIQGLDFSGKTLLTLVNDILDLSKIEKGKLNLEAVPFDLIQLLENLASGHAAMIREKNLQYQTIIESNVDGQLVGDPFRLTQVLNNLISNAIKFTDHGSITLKVAQKADDIYRFEVQDTGIGIPKKRIGNIFNSFEQANSSTTREYGGTGLGLSISKKIIEAMGGKVWVESHLNNGSTFFFEVPLEAHSGEIQISDEPSEGIFIQGKTVLLVDDNPINLLIAKNYLANWNIKVETASNGQEATDLSATKTYDAILMDLHMPVMDGYEASKEIKRQNDINLNTPIFALTADMQSDKDDNLERAGISGLIPKPIDPNKLYKVLKASIDHETNSEASIRMD